MAQLKELLTQLVALLLQGDGCLAPGWPAIRLPNGEEFGLAVEPKEVNAASVLRSLLSAIRVAEAELTARGEAIPPRIRKSDAERIARAQAAWRTAYNLAADIAAALERADRWVRLSDAPEGVVKERLSAVLEWGPSRFVRPGCPGPTSDELKAVQGDRRAFAFGLTLSVVNRQQREEFWPRIRFSATDLENAKKYLAYLRCREAGEPWGEKERWLQIADKAITELASNCPLCGREFSDRGYCSVGAYDSAPDRHSSAHRAEEGQEDPLLRRLVTAEGRIVAEVRVCAQDQHHNVAGLYDGDVYRLTHRNRLSWWESWWDGQSPISSVTLALPSEAPQGAKEGDLAQPSPAPEPTPAPSSASSAFAHLEDRDFSCACGARVTLGRAMFRAYKDGQEVAIACEFCKRSGMVRKG